MRYFFRPLSLVLMLVMLGSIDALAQRLQFTSRTSGISMVVPAGTHKVQDNLEMLYLQTADHLFSFTAVPFDLRKTTSDERTVNLMKMARSAQMDYAGSTPLQLQTQTMDIELHASTYLSGGGTFVGIAVVRESSLAYYLCLVAGQQYEDFGGASIQTLEFDPNAVSDIP